MPKRLIGIMTILALIVCVSIVWARTEHILWNTLIKGTLTVQEEVAINDDPIITTDAAADTVDILVGNLKVGDGTPSTAQDGEDMYVEGGFEVDGTARFDGAIDANSTMTLGNTLTFDGATAYADIPEMTAPGNPASDVGRLYVADSGGTTTLYFKDSAGTATNLLTAATGNTLDAAYDQGGAGVGAKINADSGTVEIEVADTSNNTALLLDMDDVTNNPVVLQISNAGTGNDITADNWSISKAGTFTTTGDISAAAGTFSGAVTVGSLSSATTFYQQAIVAASSGNVNLTIDAAGTGTITLGGTSTGKVTTDNLVELFGNVDIGDAATDTLTITSIIDGDVTLDDGSGASPSLILKDASDETATFSKADSGNISITTLAADGFQVLTGNLRVGNGSPGTAAMDGEDAYIEGELEVDGSVQLDGAVTIAGALTASSTVDLTGAVVSGASPLVFEGATSNAFETTIAITDPTADRTVTIPDQGGNVLLFANANTQDQNLIFEGATADDYETTIAITDPTADRTVTVPDGGGTVMLSSLATNATDAANAVTGASNALVFEGATADAFETSVSATDPTADRTVTLPDAGGAVILSTGGVVDSANAISGTSNGLVFEGATANDYETTLTLTDPTADRTLTLPDETGTILTTASAPTCTGAWTFSSNITANGNITGDGATEVVGVKYDVVNKTQADTPVTVTIAESNTVFTNSGATGGVEFDLPEASTAIGTTYTFIVMAAQTLDIDPEASDQILPTTDAVGDRLRSSTVGDTVTLVAVDATNWVITSNTPAATDWTDAN